MISKHPLLVINPDPYQTAVITRALSEANFNVVTNAQGEYALDLIDRVMPALVLLDWNLADMSALSVTRAIRARPGWETIAVVLTGKEISTENKILALEAGVDYCLEGTISPRELTARVRALLRRAGRG